MSELQVFSNAEFGSVRSITVNGEPYFVGKDVAEILGYGNTRDALIAHVDEEDRTVIQKSEIPTLDIPNRGLTVINESGLYSLILSSRLPSAKRFKRWVTSEVLPAIRKHGVFAMDDIMNNTDALIEALQAFKAERLKRIALEQETAVQKQQLAEMRPKASYYDVVLNSPSLLAVSEFAKDYGWSAKRMNQYLHEKGVQRAERYGFCTRNMPGADIPARRRMPIRRMTGQRIRRCIRTGRRKEGFSSMTC